jgi:hypothetical protein
MAGMICRYASVAAISGDGTVCWFKISANMRLLTIDTLD